MLMVEHKHTRNVISRTRLSDSIVLSRSPYIHSVYTLSHTYTHKRCLAPLIVRATRHNQRNQQ